MLCDEREEGRGEGGGGFGVGGRLKRQEMCVYLRLIHVVVQQKLTQYCEAIVLQLKKEKKKKG